MDNDNRMKEGMIDRSNMKFENEYARSNPALKEIRDQATNNKVVEDLLKKLDKLRGQK